jgi:Aminoglycoside-2''-adenylyltransferase
MLAHMARTDTPWEPASPAEVAGFFGGCPARWWIAGGYAIELAVGSPYRGHGDIDILLLRRDQLAVQKALPGWEWHAADPPGTLRPWKPAEQPPASVHDIWCRPGPAEPWQLQIMLDESSGEDWVSRRDQRIRQRHRPEEAVNAWPRPTSPRRTRHMAVTATPGPVTTQPPRRVASGYSRP